MADATQTPETLEFKAELRQLLHLITHSLYSHREIFLRELISNASDAINRLKFNALQHEHLLENDKDWKIKITADKAARTLTISDNGIGLTRDAAVENLGTIARSGTRAFLESLRQANATDRPELIGQFGVGFYSSFMVADKVVVRSRAAGEPASAAVQWESDGQGEFSIETIEKVTRGTDVILHLKEDAKEFLEEWTLRGVVKKFSDFIEHPVALDVERGEGDKKEITEEVLNLRKAVWLRNRSEVTSEEYSEFYKSITGDQEPPAKVIHYAAEGRTEFRALMFIPAKRPFAFQWEEPKAGLRLYVQRVLIMDRCEELLPEYLRFVKGVVDSADLPLNVSREILQQNRQLDTIRKSLVKNVFDSLAALKEQEPEKYRTFFTELGELLKEGVARDWENKQKLADLLLLGSMNTPAGQFTTLAEYVEKMPEGQKEIYYLVGESREMLSNSPYLEAFKSRGFDVLLLTDPIDEFAMPSLGEYKGKKLVQADRGELPDPGDETAHKEATELYKGLVAAMKEKLPEVADVRVSRRLTDSAACLVADAGAMSAHLERLMAKMGRDLGEAKRVLELNPLHPAVIAVRELHAKNAADTRLDNYARLFYEQAVLAEGSKVKDPTAFARRINELIAADAGR